MKYYSEITKKTYETEKDCLAAEEEVKQKKTERQKDAEVVKDLQTKYLEAYDLYCKAVNEFVQKYGSYKTSYERNTISPLLFKEDPFKQFFNLTF